MSELFALIDCNNFFVSCERIFRPDLEGRPVVVLSSNDGCMVARSNEAKALGVPMGAPVFKYRELFKQHSIVQFSANFELYGDISERIIRILTGVTPRTEVYSIDESFIELSHLEITDRRAWALALRQRILREVGVPVSIGIASSKTLAKLASEYAKIESEQGGVLDMHALSPDALQAYLLRTPINELWGIGWRLAPRLRAEGIFTALDVARLAPKRAAQLMGVHGRQMAAELNGTCCHPLELFGKVRQSVMHGRMFGQDTSEFAVIESAIASLTARATYRLRRDELLARTAIVSLSTNRHKPGYIRQHFELKLTTPSADTGLITRQLVDGLQELFIPGRAYHRANVLLYDLVGHDALQLDLLGTVDHAGSDRARARLQAFDAINARYGRTTLRFAAEDLSQRWEPKHQLRSPRYTTQWDELPVAAMR